MKELFKCSYCYVMGSKEEIEKHEAECPYNPANQTCLTCKYRTKRRPDRDSWFSIDSCLKDGYDIPVVAREPVKVDKDVWYTEHCKNWEQRT